MMDCKDQADHYLPCSSSMPPCCSDLVVIHKSSARTRKAGRMLCTRHTNEPRSCRGSSYWLSLQSAFTLRMHGVIPGPEGEGRSEAALLERIVSLSRMKLNMNGDLWQYTQQHSPNACVNKRGSGADAIPACICKYPSLASSSEWHTYAYVCVLYACCMRMYATHIYAI